MSKERSLNMKNSARTSKSRLDIAKSNRSKRKKLRIGKGSTNGTKGFRKAAKIFMIFIVIGLVLMLGGSIYAFSWLQSLNDDLPSPEEVYPTTPTATFIYDRKGQELYKVIGDFNSDPVDIDAIPEHVKWAFLASEDSDFYTHNGFDTEGILRCAFNIASTGGASFCGASTITQQLIKITALSNETSKVERKIKELFLSTKVEQQNSKEEILEMYLRVAPFGSNVVGIETAADFYFRKEPKDLTLAEAAILSAMVQNPARFSPTKPWHGDVAIAQEEVKTRQEEHVLYQMESKLDQINEQIIKNYRDKAQKAGVEFKEEEVPQITQEMIDEAKDQELVYSAPVATDKLAGHFVDFVINELQTKPYKNGEEPLSLADLQGGGYRIYTTLDYDMQKIAEDQVKAGAAQYASTQNYANAAVMTLQPSTGEIYTMAGSKDFYGESEGCNEAGAECRFNPEVNVLTTPQSPGSTNKPLGYYKNYEIGTLYAGSFLPDIPISIGSYTPKNWNGSFKGLNYTAKQALVDSHNIPALIAIEMIGIQTYIDEAKEWGYTVGYEHPENLGHSVILGGTDILAVEHAAAYAVFANQGDYVGYQSILRIEDKDGNIVYEAKPNPKRVADPKAAFMMNYTLINHPHFTSWDGRDVSAKTGTSENGDDNWIVAYSPDFVTVAWTGNNNNDDGAYNAYPIYTITPWLRGYMQQIGNLAPFNSKTPFSRPGFVTKAGGTCDASAATEDGKCIGFFSDWVIQDKIPPSYITLTRAKVCDDQPTRIARDIDISTGHAIDKTFAIYKMPAPAWQGFLDVAVEKAGGYPNKVPTENCDIDRSGGVVGPFFTINSPTSGETVSGSIHYLGSTFTGSGTITALEFYLNGVYLDASNVFTNTDATLDISGLGLDNGTYPFTIRATDSAGNTNEKTVNVIVGAATSGSFVFSTLPAVAIVNTPAPIGVQYNGSTVINNSMSIDVIKDGAVVQTLTATKQGNQYRVDWTPTQAGTYEFRATASTAAGGTLVSSNSSSVVAN